MSERRIYEDEKIRKRTGQDRRGQDRIVECVPSEEFPIDALSITPHSNSPNLSS